MKISKLIPALAAGLLLMVAAPRLFADNSTNEVTITGSMVCGKCTLHLTKECQDVVQVEKDGKTVNYFLTPNDVSNNAHEPICDPGNSEKVTVTGTVAEKDGKEVMTPTKIAVNKS
ncbi:MAG TPA: DUF6370 family protein [Candidatus Aquilonibacter sp.]|nr:DUF6370 family protein [Candidatus Aquilonibacter sp.]